ncbi:MAG: O-antigen ligase family protein [Bacteroidia bacterium]
MNAVNISKTNKGFAAVVIATLIAYAIGNVYAISQDFWYLSLLPVGLGIIAFAILKPEQFWLFMVFLTPFSLNVQIDFIQSSVSLPTEPFIAFFMVLLIFKYLLDNKIDFAVLKHPITIIILLQLVWLFISACFSTLPLVSFKYFLARLWFVIVFYFFGVSTFKNLKRIDQYNWYYLLAMGAAILYTLVRHSTEYFSHEYSYKAALPFFSDHNIYAVIVAFFIPTAVIYSLKNLTLRVSLIRSIFFYLITVVYIVGVVASYTRAAWVSLVVAFAMYLALLLKLKLRHLVSALLIIVSIIAFSWNDIMLYMSKNKVESNSDIDAHVQSIYNVTTDDSNTERLNRWSAAVRMFLEKPIVGFGPNTYQFKYAPYQLSKEKTKISTNLGDLGNAHSEFIGPLAEQGLIGAILVIALMLYAIHTGMQLYYKSKNNRVRYLALMVLLSFLTYYSHGLLNNYLDIDKANVMFWAAMAMLTALSVYHINEKDPTKEMQ